MNDAWKSHLFTCNHSCRFITIGVWINYLNNQKWPSKFYLELIRKQPCPVKKWTNSTGDPSRRKRQLRQAKSPTHWLRASCRRWCEWKRGCSHAGSAAYASSLPLLSCETAPNRTGSDTGRWWLRPGRNSISRRDSRHVNCAKAITRNKSAQLHDVDLSSLNTHTARLPMTFKSELQL